MRQNYIAQFIQLLKHWLCDVQLGIVMEKNGALSIDHCWLQMLQFLVHLINLLNILLRCDGYAGIQKAVMDQTGSRSPTSEHDPFFGASLALGIALELLLGPTTELIVQIYFLFQCHSLIEKWFIVVA